MHIASYACFSTIHDPIKSLELWYNVFMTIDSNDPAIQRLRAWNKKNQPEREQEVTTYGRIRESGRSSAGSRWIDKIESDKRVQTSWTLEKEFWLGFLIRKIWKFEITGPRWLIDTYERTMKSDLQKWS